MLVALVLAVGLVGFCNGHSWLTCTDYLEENGEYWSSSFCRAYPRHASQYANKEQFGVDTGYNHFGKESTPCKSSRDDSGGYDSTYRMAVYYPGQRIVLTHPTKNHVADTCTNMWIPDNGMVLYMSSKSGDVKMSEYKANPIWDFGKSPNGQNNGFNLDKNLISTYPKPGYQNAPKFCENQDKALATMAFELPTNVKPGRYSFLWAWWFNSISDEYNGCFEADVVATKGERDAILKQREQTTIDPVNIYDKNGGGKPVTSAPGASSTTNGAVIKVDGGWGAFSIWDDCSVTCGGGVQRRVRHCDNPAPQNGGAMCTGSDEETRNCNTDRCPLTGGVTFNNLKVEFTSYWEHGANAIVVLPSYRPMDVTYVIEFPCATQGVYPWHVNDVSIPDEMARGVYTFKQSDQWMRDKPDFGFTVQFGQCKVRQGSEVKITANFR